MPVQAVVFGERRAAAERELGTKLLVERVALRGEDRQRVGAAFEEHADEHGLRGTARRSGDALLERREPEPRAAVHGEHGAHALGDERAP